MSTKTVLERVEALEKEQKGFNDSVNAAFNRLTSSLQGEMEVTEALVNVLNVLFPAVDGKPSFSGLVETEINSRKEKRAAEQEDRDRKMIEGMVAAGQLVVSNNLGPTSVLVARLFTVADGAVVKPRIQIEFGRLTPEAQVALAGKGVGDTFEAEGQKLEVLEVYDLVKTPVTPPTA